MIRGASSVVRGEERESKKKKKKPMQGKRTWFGAPSLWIHPLPLCPNPHLSIYVWYVSMLIGHAHTHTHIHIYTKKDRMGCVCVCEIRTAATAVGRSDSPFSPTREREIFFNFFYTFKLCGRRDRKYMLCVCVYVCGVKIRFPGYGMERV